MKQISRFIWGVATLLIAQSLSAQTTYPDKAIRMVVGFPAGSQPDTVARLLSQELAKALGKAIIVDNATGAAGNIAADRVAKAAPDGYTVGFMVQGQLAINPSLYKVAYDPLKDFAPISQVTASPNMLVVHNAVPTKSVKALVALAKAQPGALTFASGGSGSSTHMAAELFKSATGVDIQHIPYKGGAAALPDLLGGRVTMMFGTLTVVLPLVRDGKLRALAVTSSKRTTAAPEFPTIAESGYSGFEATTWNALLAPASTQPAIIRRLHVETVKALASSDLRTKLADLGLEAIGGSPDELATLIKAEIPKWAKVIKDAGVKPD
jgi:tripartite-type tricarboxylate transporter receptor subunit TctC